MGANNSKRSVVVVGGGGAGSNIAGYLSTKLDPAQHSLTLINARPFHVFLPATVRMTVTTEGKLEDQILIPFDRVMSKGIGEFKVGRVMGIEKDERGGGSVVLEGGEKVWYDVLVLAPGTMYEGPIEYPDTMEATLGQIEEWRKKVLHANTIVLSGGGPVNIELSGEIRYYYPEKKVTIVQSGYLPLNKIYPDYFRERVAEAIESRGVKFIFNDYLDQDAAQDGFVTTRKGQKIPADLVMSSHGGRPNTDFIRTLGPDAVTSRGLVPVEPSLELCGHPGIFCAGDVLDNSERNTLGKYEGHANVIVANVLKRLRGELCDSKYEGTLEAIGITMGKTGGVTYLGDGTVEGDEFTRKYQAEKLLVPYGRGKMGYEQTDLRDTTGERN